MHQFASYIIGPLIVMIAFAGVTQADEGGFVWARSLGAGGHDYGQSMAVDSDNNLVIVGSFEGLVDFDPGPGTTSIAAVGNSALYILKLDSDANFMWVRIVDETDAVTGNSVAVDAAGSIFTAGSFRRTIDFDPGVGINNITAESNPYTDAFILKLDRDGNFVWARSMGGSGSDAANAISIDSSGNVYTTGEFQDPADFDPGVGTSILTSTGAYPEVFISKLDNAGNFIWARSMGGAFIEASTSIAIDAMGNVLTIGTFRGTADFDPGTQADILESNGGFDIFISKLNSDGDHLWAHGFGWRESDQGLSITSDIAGNVYATGYFNLTVDFDPSVDSSTLYSAGGVDAFILKLDSQGQFRWVRGIGGISSAGGVDIKSDDHGNCYAIGWFSGTTEFYPAPRRMFPDPVGAGGAFLTKLDTNGGLEWVRAFGATGGALGSEIIFDNNGYIYATGQYWSTADFDPGLGTYNQTSNGSIDTFVSKLSPIDLTPPASSGPGVPVVAWPFGLFLGALGAMVLRRR